MQDFLKEGKIDMLNLTSAKVSYSALFLTTALSLGGVISNKAIVAATGLVGNCASAAVALFNKDKKILEQLNEANSLSLKDREYTNCKCSELKFELDSQFVQVQEALQILQLSTEENNKEQKKGLDKLQKRVSVQHAQTQRRIQSNYDKFNHRATKLEAAVSQDTAKFTSQSVSSKQVTPMVVKSKTKHLEITGVKTSSRPPKAVVFIDQSNFHHACEDLGIEPDYGALMCMLTPESGNCEIRIYLGVYDRPSRKQEELSKELKGLGYNVIEHSITVRPDGSKKVVGDDNQLTCDLLTMVLNGEIGDRDRVVLMSSDGDFKPVLQKVREQGISVDLIAHKPSHHLLPLVSQVTHLNQVMYDICQYKLFEVA